VSCSAGGFPGLLGATYKFVRADKDEEEEIRIAITPEDQQD